MLSSQLAARFDEHESAKLDVEPMKLFTDPPEGSAGRTRRDEGDDAIVGCEYFRESRIGRRDREPIRSLTRTRARDLHAWVKLSSDGGRGPLPITPAHDHGARTPSVVVETLTHGLSEQVKSGPRPHVERVTPTVKLVRAPRRPAIPDTQPEHGICREVHPRALLRHDGIAKEEGGGQHQE